MTRQELIQAMKYCIKTTSLCPLDCPLHGNTEACEKTMLGEAIRLLESMPEEGTLMEAKEGNAMAPGVISEIMSHYKSPLVTINFQEMEENPC